MVSKGMGSEAERRWVRVLGTLNEAQARLFVAEKALELGRGGISHLCELTGMSRVTITKGIAQLRGRGRLRVVEEGRVRRAGSGRRSIEEVTPRFRRALEQIVEETTAGDPMSLLRWTSKSTRTIAEEMTRRGLTVSHMTVARCLTRARTPGQSRRGSDPRRRSPPTAQTGDARGLVSLHRPSTVPATSPAPEEKVRSAAAPITSASAA